jgi:anti-anti-sigma factor
MKLSLVSIERDGVVRVSSEGNITCEDFRAEGKNPLESVLGASWSNNRVILDLDRTNYIDSSAIGWLIDTSKRFKQAGGALAVHSVRPAVRQVLELLKVERIVPLAHTESAARELVAGGLASTAGGK